jgi:hypothetical protein
MENVIDGRFYFPEPASRSVELGFPNLGLQSAGN